ncbi:MAG TPA: hypothetical protein VH143_07905 [Kofleriaceae bacterium]|jgi:hypothetical protein|nr:hypothetical protein [Kofleriaceae bacterium]
MRIACIHIPQYALQCATRVDPSLRGAPVAMVAGQGAGTGVLHAPIVVACSRAAWTLGVRLGMTAAAARNVSAELSVVGVESQLERETTRAVADALLALTGVVDIGGRVGAGGAHLALYAEVPTRTRGNAFGERVLDKLRELGLLGRIGIADDRFTAWVAAAYGAVGQRLGDHGASPHEPEQQHQHDVITVPRGGSAAFLSPRPLSLLAIAPEVQHMLEALGVRTLGEFAALPAPSVARPLEADYQALARGDSGSSLRPYAPEAAIREEIVVLGGNVLDGDNAIAGPTAIGVIAQRLALRLAGRQRSAIKIELAIAVANGNAAATTERGLELDTPIDSADELARVLSPVLETVPEGPWKLRAIVTGEAVAGAIVEAAPATTHMAVVAGAVGRAAEPRAIPNGVPIGPVRAELPNDPYAVVLSTTGTLFALSAPDDGRPGLDRAHRRTRRGKQRRLRPALALGLFDRTGG